MTRSALIFAAAVILVVAATLGLAYAGFCFGQKRFLSDNDYINAVVDRVVAQRRHQLISREGNVIRFTPVTVIPYRDREEFRSENPGCCQIFDSYVGDQFFPSTLLQKLTARAAANVSVTYKVRYLDEQGQPQQDIAEAE